MAKVKILDATGAEPNWDGVEVTDNNRLTLQMVAFNWYNYEYDNKKAMDFLEVFLKKNGDTASAKQIKKTPVANAYGWLARMATQGYPINPEEVARIQHAIVRERDKIKRKSTTSVEADSAEVTANKKEAKKLNIQERMLEKCREAGGEIDGMLDEYVAGGAKASHKFKPITTLKAANPLPHHVNELIESYTAIRDEFQEAYEGKDKQLNEAYAHLSKIQLRNLVKFADLVIADCNSYITFKKANKTPRKRKPVSPDKQVAKLKYMKQDDALGVTSIKPVKILESKEVFVYSTKKRKLYYLVADEHAGNALMVKNNTIIGFDPTKSTGKTVRKPEEFIKEFMKASKPGARKLHKDIKAVEVKFSGRFADDYLILKVW